MPQDLVSSLASLSCTKCPPLLVQELAGQYRPASPEEVLQVAQGLLRARLRDGDVLTSPADVRAFLQVRLCWQRLRVSSGDD